MVMKAWNDDTARHAASTGEPRHWVGDGAVDVRLLRASGGAEEHFFRSRPTGAPEAWQPPLAQAPIPREPAVDRRIDVIQRTLGLSVKDLAAVCGVTRKTVYDWRRGSRPQAHHEARLRQLYRAAVNWRSEGYPEPAAHLHEPLHGERSLFDLLTASELDLEAIQFTGARLAFGESAAPKAPLKDPFAGH